MGGDSAADTQARHGTADVKDFSDYYQVLGVTRFATADEIRTAYRRAARRYHPDVNPASDASARMAQVNEAHDVLSDPAKRSAYDTFGARHGANEGSQAAPPRSDSSQSNGSHANRVNAPRASAAPGHDIFSSIFGRRADRPTKPGMQGFTSGDPPFKGCDQEARVEITVAEAYHGTMRTITLRPPPLAATVAVGARTSTRAVEVCIPKGVRDGQRVRLAGQGSPSLSGGRPGDLYLEVKFTEDPRISTDGCDVHQKLPVTPWEAALGATIEAATVAGQVELRIPPGSQSGRRLRLRGKGLPAAEPGDLFLEIELVLPPAKSEAARKLYAQMAREMKFDPRAEMREAAQSASTA